MERSPRRAVVVGSGLVGAAIAHRLVLRGCRTTLVEAGAPLCLTERPDAPPGEHLRNQERFRQAPEAFVVEAIARCTFFDPAAPPDGLPGACETIAFGGQGTLWTNNCPRAEAGLERWAALDDAGWERRYAEAETLLQVGTTAVPDGERQRRVAARLRAHLARDGRGRRVAPLPLAATRERSGRVHYTGPADVFAQIPDDGRLEVLQRTRALRLEQRAGRVHGVRVEHAGAERTLDADVVLVAAGAFAAPRLLHDSGIRPHALGRWLHYHPLRLAQVVLDDDLAAPPGSIDPPPRLWIPPSAAAPWHGMVLRDLGAGSPLEETEERRLIELQFFAPVAPRAENRMLLDAPAQRFAVQLDAHDRAVLDALDADVHAIGAALGRFRRGAEPGWNPWGFSHPMGTTRMGDDPDESVCDRSGRVHGFANLYVAGTGVIPVAIAVNPTLTAVALALESAEHAAAA